ncbi:MAG: isoleucine--tRNA ligase [Candidatus Obscuribacterales bacterium]|nr:isoleucine--tRNA ligase [Cyanobacteria bacterium HKST-UBA01]MCB9468259.1 isoleucine--tRNA ligase [Candidatus Obscuribacterales bacterium]
MSGKTYAVNLPKTDFPMKANSAVREVEFQSFWNEIKVYEKSLERRKDAPKFVLHDGPPYLSSSKIHIGTALNKILKDIVTKYKSQKGFYSPYVPGYDSHGLPIENAVLKKVKGGRAALTPVQLREQCRDFALSNLKGQEENFRRLGVWGDWASPYITLDPKLEATQLRVFGKMAEKGYLYKGLKSVQWCPNCETALAEAEVEYADHRSHSIYVKFAVDDEFKGKLPAFVPAEKKTSFVIWTTTPWTLPGNLGVALHPEFTYEFLDTRDHGVLVVVDELKSAFLEATGLAEENPAVLGTAKGAELELIECRHPFMDRRSRVIVGDHVTTEVGTGCVHTAPGHGPEDFEIGKQYDLGVLSPVDGRGIFTEEAGKYCGERFDKSNEPIVEHLREIGALMANKTYSHSYPHCWRCKKPLIFRATEQWFASVDGFRKDALKAIDSVKWIPASGRNRIYTMVENRADWCISRQRAWGVPIPVFYCGKCHHHKLDTESVEKVACVFEQEGSDAWWKKSAAELIGADATCEKCGNKGDFEKETDIMDVWFDSGVTHASVVDARPELKGSPCELYLEGSDQHRGWFQSSLLTSVAVKGEAPYRTVLTHGFVVDEKGKKMSKSVGNVVEPEQVIKQYGADVLRLWVASVNYTDDIPIGKNMLQQLADIYRKLRNTARYLLGNLYDFDPAVNSVPLEELGDLDRFILHRLQIVVDKIGEDFDSFEFFKYYQLLQKFCVVDLSSFYFDIVKDRLYTCAPDAQSRRAVQTVLHELLLVLVRLLVPVTPHMAEDIWKHIPEAIRSHNKLEESVLLTDFPEPKKELLDETVAAYFPDLIEVRYTVNKALEEARSSRSIGSSLEAQVVLDIEDKELYSKVTSLGESLPGFFITSQALVLNNGNGSLPSDGVISEAAEDGVKVVVLKADGEKCVRCWKFSTEIGSDSGYTDLCKPCTEAVKETKS